METWLKYQIDYLERMYKRKFTPKEVEAIKWYMALDKQDKEVFLAILRKHKPQ